MGGQGAAGSLRQPFFLEGGDAKGWRPLAAAQGKDDIRSIQLDC